MRILRLAPSDCKMERQDCSSRIEVTCMDMPPTSMLTSHTKIPSITLDTEFVTDSMAARLCTSLVGHVLFLKSQVPFPIMQLARMPDSDVVSRAAKKRQELINSFDTLSSHLNTTFTALSTAFASRGATVRENGGRAYLAVVLGPTPGSSRSRVIVGVDALEARVWGERDDPSGIPSGRAEGQQRSNNEDGRDGGDESNSDYDNSDTNSDKGSEVSDSDGDGTESETGSCEISQAPSPPSSRTPSPTSSLSLPPRPPSGSYAYAQELEALRTAERLLSRTLASACGENDGQSMASEMPPTQTHIVLRAPRRFVHPAWVPKQTLSGAFDALLDGFLEVSGEYSTCASFDVKKKKKGGKMEGLWIRGRKRATEQIIENDNGEIPEEDEMIWWTWEGKLVGFADW